MADRRERVPDDGETLRTAFESLQARLWTALPCIVTKFDPEKMTVSAQPAINGSYRTVEGTMASIQMPVLLDCPVLWQGGGGVTLTFPIKPGNECLVILASRCIDGWYARGAVCDPPEFRMHNLSDGFALVGVRSLPHAFEVDTVNAALTTDDGSTYFKLKPGSKTITITAPGGINLNGVTIDSSGNIGTTGTVTANTDVVGGGKSLKTHTHGGVQTGSGTSGPPS